MSLRPRPRHLARVVVAAGLVLGIPATAQAAEQFAGLTADNQLVLFRSDSPGNLQSSVPVTGLQSNEVLLALDVRPADERIYALGSSNRIWIINPATGNATPVSNTPFSPALQGQSFAFSIDAASDQARVVSNTGQNLRISVTNGQTAAVDSPYAYQSGDANTGSTPLLSALSYSQPPVGGGFPSLYGIDTTRDVLVSAATSAATIRTIGTLNLDASEPAALDITRSGEAFAALRSGGVAFPQLYRIDLGTGAATPIAPDPARATIAYRTSSATAKDTPIIAMASLGAAPDDKANPRISLASSSTQLDSLLLSSGLRFTIACNEACGVSGTLTVGGATLGPVTGGVLAGAGTTRLTIPLDAASRALIRKRRSVLMTLKVTVSDAAGNTVSATRPIRSRVG